MSFIGKNIKKIRSLKKISQSEFAKIFDLTRGSIGAYEEGRAEPKIDTLVQLANYFGVSVDAFINKELTVADLYSLDLVKEKLNEAHHFGKEPELAYRKGGIGLVKLNNQLEYVVNLGNKDFINKLNGSEMEYHQNGLHHGDILLCLQVDLKSKKPEKGKVYLLVVGGRIVTRRLKDVDDNKLYLMSDDPNYHDLEFSLEEIMQIWEVKGAYSTYLNPPKMLDEKVMLLETQMEEVLKKMKGMKK
jgi:transcriptional regulator with XRE-family HTH domain